MNDKNEILDNTEHEIVHYYNLRLSGVEYGVIRQELLSKGIEEKVVNRMMAAIEDECQLELKIRQVKSRSSYEVLAGIALSLLGGILAYMLSLSPKGILTYMLIYAPMVSGLGLIFKGVDGFRRCKTMSETNG